jgi:transketolase
VDALFAAVDEPGDETPKELVKQAGAQTTLRAALGESLNYLNKASNGAIFAAAADLLGSTSINVSAKGFPEGYYNAQTNHDARLLSIGGICEDAMCGILGGLSTYGRHVGAGSSYGAFIGALGHIASRLHSIGGQSRQEIKDEPYKPYFLVCAHAGLKTGEDGPTHADPQPLQLLQENFPAGTMITLTPWDPQELWPLVKAALRKRPSVIAPFVTRPTETVLDRDLGLAPPSSAAKGMYALKTTNGEGDGTVVLQGSEVTYAFLETALPLLEREGVNLHVYYVSSAELFNMLPQSERESIYPDRLAQEAMGITGFTLPTMYRWVRSEFGLAMTMHPFQKGRFLGSGQGHMVLQQAGLDGKSQFTRVMEYVKGKGK